MKDDLKLVSVIIPVFNEEKYIKTILTLVDNADIRPLSLDKEIIVVNDCSTDNTSDLLDNLRILNDRIKVIHHKKNEGKGAAIRTGIKAAQGDIVLIQDADLEYDPNEYLKLITPIVDDKADIVYGSRFAGGEAHRVLYFWHYIGNKFLTLLSNMLTDLNLTDMETCYKVFKSDVIKQIEIEENRFGFEPEITAKVARLARIGKCRIFEVGISYNGRTYLEGKKISWKDGFSALRCILKYNIFR